MSTAIDTVTVGGVEDRRLQLANAQAARVIDIGTSWSKIRLGIRFAWDDTGANLGGTPRLCLGMLSNPNFPLTNGPLGATTGHFVGMATKFGDWARSAGPPVRYTGTSPAFAAVKKIGATFTSADMTTSITISGSPTTRRLLLILDITKGAPNFTFGAIWPFGATIFDAVSNTHLIDAMNIATFAAMKTYFDGLYAVNSYLASGTPVLAVDEATNGSLNAVCVAWDRATPTTHISDFIWKKMA